VEPRVSRRTNWLRGTGVPPLRSVHAPNGGDLVAAEQVVRSHLAVTPVVAAPALAGNALLKVETVQPTGSFKMRGVLAALSAAELSRRVVTASAGDHALGLAQAAALLGRPGDGGRAGYGIAGEDQPTRYVR
jgi:threonine dehydratase